MTLIPSFQEFEENNPLNGRITPALAESLAEYFAGEESVNEGVFDSIKNTLSKTFLGSLSYISMIDKVRAEVLKLEKESLQKKYDFEDEMDSLKNSIKELSKSKDEAGIERVNKTVEAKTKEYQSYGKMTNLRIEKAISTIKDAIKGNKRRMEYWEAGKSQDELDLAEFEYRIAKQRATSNPEDLKDLQEEIKKAKDEAEKSKKKLETDVKNQEEKEKEGSSDYKKSLRTKKGRIEAIAKLEHEIVDLQKELKNAKKEFDKKEIQIKIDSVNATMKNIENLEKKNKNKKVMPSQDLAISDELAKKVHDIIDNKLRTSEVKPERKPIGFPIPGSEKASSETAKEKGKEKAEEVKKQEAPAPTSKKVNASVKNKK
jgi:chromosome segregation ATPase